MDLCANALAQGKLPFNVHKRLGDFNPGANANSGHGHEGQQRA